MNASDPPLGFWDFGEEKEDSIHRIHSYPAKFPAFIATKALQYATDDGVIINNVADIFCGCGTTAVESKKNGKHYWGCDINPVATLIAQVKTSKFKDTTVDRYYSTIIKTFDSMTVDVNDIERLGNRIEYWFDRKTIKDLWKLKRGIEQMIPSQSVYSKFFFCAFSNILKPASRWLTKSIKPQIDPNKSPINVREIFEKQIDMMKKANKENAPLLGNSRVCIENRNFLSTRRKPKNAPDLIITSPPYVTSYDYADIHQLSILWLDYAEDYRSMRENMIGNKYGITSPTKSDVRKLEDTGRTVYENLLQVHRLKALTVAKYFIDMRKAVEKCQRLLNNDGMAIFVIGDTQYKGVSGKQFQVFG